MTNPRQQDHQKQGQPNPANPQYKPGQDQADPNRQPGRHPDDRQRQAQQDRNGDPARHPGQKQNPNVNNDGNGQKQPKQF